MTLVVIDCGNLSQVKFNKSDTVFINDAIGPDRVIETYNILPNYLVVDHWSSYVTDYNLYCSPIWLADQVEKIDLLSYDDVDVLTTDYSFNFIINKKQINRFLCIKFVELFELQNFEYTWSGAGREFDLSNIIDEMNALGRSCPLSLTQKCIMLQSIKLQEKFIGTLNVDNNVGVRISDCNWPWYNGLREIYSFSAISLITESVRYEKGSLFTEKSLYPLLGLSFPIWIGGYQQASEWKRMGFDIFEDVIDHSYENYNTLIERCYYAFFNNLDLLKNFDKLKEIRQQMLPRLKNNYKLVENKHLAQLVKQQILQWPVELQQHTFKFIEKRYPKLFCIL